MSSSSNSSTFKILIVGNAGVGKTTLIKRNRTAEFEKKYIATEGVDITKLSFNTFATHNRSMTSLFAENQIGNITFEMYDVSGQEKYDELNTECYKGANAAIIMFDVTSKITYKDIPSWYNSIHIVCPDIPIVLCGNKVDCIDRQVKPKDIQFHRQKNIQYYDISAKSNYNFEKPFLYLARCLTNSNLNFCN